MSQQSSFTNGIKAIKLAFIKDANIFVPRVMHQNMMLQPGNIKFILENEDTWMSFLENNFPLLAPSHLHITNICFYQTLRSTQQRQSHGSNEIVHCIVSFSKRLHNVTFKSIDDIIKKDVQFFYGKGRMTLRRVDLKLFSAVPKIPENSLHVQCLRDIQVMQLQRSTRSLSLQRQKIREQQQRQHKQRQLQKKKNKQLQQAAVLAKKRRDIFLKPFVEYLINRLIRPEDTSQLSITKDKYGCYNLMCRLQVRNKKDLMWLRANMHPDKIVSWTDAISQVLLLEESVHPVVKQRLRRLDIKQWIYDGFREVSTLMDCYKEYHIYCHKKI